MPVIIDLYIPKNGWLHRIDPRVKILFIIATIILLLLINNMYIMFSFLLGLHLLYLSSKIPLKKILSVWQSILPILILITTMWVIFYPEGKVLFKIWILKVTFVALSNGILVALRIISMGFTVFLLFFTTKQENLIEGLVKLKIPYEWGLILGLALRFIPNFQTMYSTISDAQKSRGLSIESEKGIKKVRMMMPILVSLFINSFQLSDELSIAMDSRGFISNNENRTTYVELVFNRTDYFYTVFILFYFCLSLYILKEI